MLLKGLSLFCLYSLALALGACSSKMENGSNLVGTKVKWANLYVAKSDRYLTNWEDDSMRTVDCTLLLSSILSWHKECRGPFLLFSLLLLLSREAPQNEAHAPIIVVV